MGGPRMAPQAPQVARRRARCLAVIVTLLAVAAPVYGAALALPPALVAAIAALDGAAIPVEPEDLKGGACRHPRPGHPARVSADFNGDGHRDYALYLRTAHSVRGHRTTAEYTVRFVVFLGGAGDAFTPHLIREWAATLPLHARIELQRPGRVREVDGGEGRVLRLRHPGILELYCGQAASTYYWEPRTRTFEYIVTGD